MYGEKYGQYHSPYRLLYLIFLSLAPGISASTNRTESGGTISFLLLIIRARKINICNSSRVGMASGNCLRNGNIFSSNFPDVESVDLAGRAARAEQVNPFNETQADCSGGGFLSSSPTNLPALHLPSVL